jgi:hypothetical protein
VYYAWWEMYPSNDITILQNFAVHPGDMDESYRFVPER